MVRVSTALGLYEVIVLLIFALLWLSKSRLTAIKIRACTYIITIPTLVYLLYHLGDTWKDYQISMAIAILVGLHTGTELILWFSRSQKIPFQGREFFGVIYFFLLTFATIGIVPKAWWKEHKKEQYLENRRRGRYDYDSRASRESSYRRQRERDRLFREYQRRYEDQRRYGDPQFYPNYWWRDRY